ncbi:MAG: glycosyltransferase family 2 protein [Chloroflexaceae bacterium]|jgi:glycosyltransferase involved in cell wall biosynthesis|nr:glycosyltransferase family 2 protein [Chloroflexaceae bacterium]
MSNRLPIAVIVLTFNEEQNIERCLASVANWAGEIWLVDSGSSDCTLDIARRYTSRIFHHPFVNYAQQRNWAQTELPLGYEWVLHLDASEWVSPELEQGLRRAFAGDIRGINGFLINRRTIFLGRWIRHGGLYPTYHMRLYRRQHGHCEDREYDQHFRVVGPVARLAGDLNDNITTDLGAWTRSHERWASAETREYFRRQAEQQANERRVQARLFGTPIERRRWLRERVYGLVPPFLRPLLYFLVRYIVLLGFLDGTQGLIYHVLHGFWYRFYVDAKIWEARQKDRNATSVVQAQSQAHGS